MLHRRLLRHLIITLAGVFVDHETYPVGVRSGCHLQVLLLLLQLGIELRSGRTLANGIRLLLSLILILEEASDILVW